jgi:cysteine-rich repeat protein
MPYKITVLAAALLAAGCSVFDNGEHRDSLLDGGADAGTDAGMEDAGPVLMFDDVCGASSPAFVLGVTQTNLAINTVGLGNHVTSSCGGAETLGADAFIAVDVQAGDYWHFHLRNDPDDLASASRQPALYLILAPGGSCDSRDCRFASDVCAESGDEHFAFVADEPGRWYLGIDDRQTGGSRYLLDALHPTCGEDGREHGEACDDGNSTDGDGCNRRCQREVTESLPNEVEPNDNPNEANMLVMPLSGELTVLGNIGGPGGCRYSDTFAIDVPPNAHVEVDVLTTGGAVCTDAALTNSYQLSLRNSASMDVVAPMTDANGCAIVRSNALAGGLYFLTATLPGETTSIAPYRLRVRVVP